MGSNWKHGVTVFTKIGKFFYALAVCSAIISAMLLPVTRDMFKWNAPAWKWLQEFANTPQGAFLKIPAACWLMSFVFLIIALSVNLFDYYYRKSRKEDF